MRSDLRAGLDLGALACLETVNDIFQLRNGQILIGILEDHHHGCVDARALTLDLFPGQRPGFVRRQRVGMNALLAQADQLFRTAQHARRRAADLDMGARADRLQLKLGVECRHFEHADIGHVQHVGDPFDRRLGDPAILLLRPHQQRNDSGLFAAFRIFLDGGLCPSGIVLAKRKGRWLDIFFG